MRAFGAEIDCESVLGEYTQFTLRFPKVDLLESQGHHLAVMERAHAAFAGKRLLVVDDDVAQRKATHGKLAPLGVQIDEAIDGHRALEALARHRYDLVLLDLRMPVLDGYAVAAEVRRGQVPINREARIVAYSSEPAHVASVKAHKAGMDGFVSKPCPQLPLVEALRQALENPRAAADGALAGRRVLVADDDSFNRKAAAAYLRHAGVTVLEAAHGRGALEHLFEPGAWDAVLMDIDIPVVNGLDTTRLIRASNLSCNRVPILALTAHSDQATVQEALEAGMNGYITKPVEAGELYRTLSDFFSGAKAIAPAKPAAQPPAPDHKGRLLDVKRLEGYRRIGILEELLDDYIAEIAQLVERLEKEVADQNLTQAIDALHSLLGMSVDAGASALYRLVRAIYVPMIEAGAWPSQLGWLEQISATTNQTQAALKAYARVSPAV
jgi:CheY-like chemotaxis protein